MRGTCQHTVPKPANSDSEFEMVFEVEVRASTAPSARLRHSAWSGIAGFACVAGQVSALERQGLEVGSQQIGGCTARACAYRAFRAVASPVPAVVDAAGAPGCETRPLVLVTSALLLLLDDLWRR